MSGEGFSLMWPEGAEPRRFECRKGTMVVPPDLWYHQQFNIGSIDVNRLRKKLLL